MLAAIAMSLVSPAASFADDLAYLKEHVKTLVLKSPSGAAVAVVPAYQGRVMTSTFDQAGGPSNGWINRKQIAAGPTAKHINVFGGEERFWLGPEGGQFSIFFKGGAKFDLANWQTPPCIDTDPFKVVSSAADKVRFEYDGKVANYMGFEFSFHVDRTVSLVNEGNLAELVGTKPEGARWVAYNTRNVLKNVGNKAWTKDTGLLSIWLLGMLNHSDTTTVVVPLKPGSGARVNDMYFGKVPADRLKIIGDTAFFKADGMYRSKIGVGPEFAKAWIGSYDPARSLLTLVHFNLPAHPKDYVNSLWELQESPFGGDVVNSYNDGPPAPGKAPLGPFYELETSSPGAALPPGQTIEHMQTTMHFYGNPAVLEPIAKKTLGVTLAEIVKAL